MMHGSVTKITLKNHWLLIATASALLALAFSLPAVLFARTANGEKPRQCAESNFHCIGEKLSVATTNLKAMPAITVAVPQPAREVRIVTYVVETRGRLVSSLSDFKTLANETLNDNRGWAKMGITFQEVNSGGEFSLVLSEASQVPSFAPGGCDSQYSCNVGRFVIINEDRWLGATPSWNAANGSLRDYRHMVVNHETGHWLGHGHRSCSASGQPAAVMQQQSINLGGCTFNPWPLTSELYAPKLGI